jgi:hypothetical protein
VRKDEITVELRIGSGSLTTGRGVVTECGVRMQRISISADDVMLPIHNSDPFRP